MSYPYCARCGRALWVRRTSLVHDGTARDYCMRCAEKVQRMMRPDPQPDPEAGYTFLKEDDA